MLHVLNNGLVDRRKLGIFYTPSEATRILCQWGIRTPKDYIFEPSFGACGFLEASRDRLADLNCPTPGEQLFGCDIDPNAFSDYLIPKFRESDPLNRFKNEDFLRVSPRQFPIDKFDTVIGNPPYISYHNMSSEQRKSVSELMQGLNYNLDSKASLWAYFLVHSLSFLKSGGRIAWILPGSLLHAEYAGAVKHIVSKNFERSLIIQLGQRLFSTEGTDESTVVLLAEGWSKEGRLKIDYAATLDDLQRIINEWQSGEWDGRNYEARAGLALLPDSVLRTLNRISEEQEVCTLGEIADVLIGIVTGANKFFIINQVTARLWHLPEHSLKLILSRFNIAGGISLKTSDLKSLAKENFRCLLVDTSEMKEGDMPLKIYLWSFPEDIRCNNVTFNKKRTVWHQPDDGRVPDAFFPYMHHYGPRLVINQAKVTSTNTIHRVFFKKECSKIKALAASISLLSTYSQLSAEIEGRTYGSGALKHEPSEAKRIRLIMPRNLNARVVNETYKRIDKLLRNNNHKEARLIADAFVLGALVNRRGDKILKTMDKALRDARARRYDSSKSVVASK
jgi:adenine-specific DNA methylase